MILGLAGNAGKLVLSLQSELDTAVAQVPAGF